MFTMDEFIVSQTATRLNIDNTPEEKILANLQMLVATMEQVRKLLGGNPIHISSGYRCPALNRAIGSSSTSAHTLGYAADFMCPKFGTPKEVALKIAESNIKFDQLIFESVWVHISIDPRNRRELLTAHFGNGKTTYTKGIE